MPQASRKLTILVAACNEAGHLNACTGETLQLKARGHRVIFVLPETWTGKLSIHGFEEFIYSTGSLPGEHPGEKTAKNLRSYGIFGPFTPKEKLTRLVNVFNSDLHLNGIRLSDGAVKLAIEKFKPDVIIVDSHSLPPSVYYSGIPWIKSCSMSPLMEVWFDDVPPGGSGLPKDGPKTEWAEFTAIRRQMFGGKIFSNLLVELGYEPYPGDVKFPPTEILTVYACPEELNYLQVRNQPNWFNLEAFNKVDASGEKSTLEDLLPIEFHADDLDGKWSGKYVYISLGSLASVDVELIKRITQELAFSNHKYIVSKGPCHEQYELPRNAWGKDYLPQTKLVPLMDFVITHGGNNTMTETFAQGIPMIVMPVFTDQLDNGQRLVEEGYGFRVEPYSFEDGELAQAVEKVLADELMKERLKKAAARIQASNRHEELAIKIEQFFKS